MTPDYIATSPVVDTNAIEMNQPDTANRIMSVCSNIINSMSPVQSRIVRLLNEEGADYTALSSSLEDSIADVDYNIDVMESMVPASALEDRANDVKDELENLRGYLTELQKAVEKKDKEEIDAVYFQVEQSINILMSYSTGLI